MLPSCVAQYYAGGSRRLRADPRGRADGDVSQREPGGAIPPRLCALCDSRCGVRISWVSQGVNGLRARASPLPWGSLISAGWRVSSPDIQQNLICHNPIKNNGLRAHRGGGDGV